jgi:TIR domain
VTVTYELHVMQVDRPNWLADIRRAVSTELHTIGMHKSVAIDVTETPLYGGTAPAVAIVLVGPAAKTDPDLAVAITAAIADGRVVIPVVDDLDTFSDQVPPHLSPFNGFAWFGDEPERRLARVLLEELGIEERDRLVFLSHKREDGLGAAEQIHDALTHQRFIPFIDRFAIPAGADVQAHIADALEKHAFLLILETPQAHLSDWVYDEVDYALSHTMGTLILQWPGDPVPIPGSLGVPRLRLSDADLTKDDHGYDVLTPGALDRLIREIEAAHAHGIVRRRRMLIRSVEDAAKSAGASCIPLKDWSLDVIAPTGRSIIAIAPRLPVPSDLQRLDETRDQLDPSASALLVHATRHLRDPARRHLVWVTGTRNLVMLPDNAIGAHW